MKTSRTRPLLQSWSLSCQTVKSRLPAVTNRSECCQRESFIIPVIWLWSQTRCNSVLVKKSQFNMTTQINNVCSSSYEHHFNLNFTSGNTAFNFRVVLQALHETLVLGRFLYLKNIRYKVEKITVSTSAYISVMMCKWQKKKRNHYDGGKLFIRHHWWLS